MDAGITKAAAPAHGAARQACFHCGLPVPLGTRFSAVIDGAERAMCCAGCAAVAQTIAANGLTAYYRRRTALPGHDGQLVAARDLDAFRLPEVEAAVSRDLGGAAREATLLLEGATCAACLWLIETRIACLRGVLGADINYATHRARVRWDGHRTTLADIVRAIRALGFRAQPYDGARAEAARRRERDQALRRLFIAGFGMMQVMMYLLPVYLTAGEMTADIEQLMRVAGLILTLPVVLYSAAPFFSGAWRDLRALQPGMDVPVALGIGAAFAASVAATVAGSGAVYFDSITMFVFLLLAARYFEMTARMRAALGQERLAQRTPAVAERLTAWPASDLAEMVAASRLHAGDQVRVRPGAAAPADGVVAAGTSEFDESLLTGESRPVAKRVGDNVIGGSLNTGSAVVVRITRAGADTVLAGILRLLERAAADKPRLARAADRAARVFVLALLVVAALTAVAWIGIDVQRALWVTVAVLVVSCPCALSLATPAALAAASGALHERGVLVTRGDALENLARATDFVFDKTGTLTAGTARVTEVIPLGADGTRRAAAECLELAAALEAASEHPVARAIVTAAARPYPVMSLVQNFPGCGVEGQIDGARVRIGAPRFVAELNGLPTPPECSGVPEEATVVAMGDERSWIALFTLTDPLRQGARAVIDDLVRTGARVHLVSGDRPEITHHVARELGIASVLAGARPRDKLDYVRNLQDGGAVVAMVGDGVNDAAGLAAAQVSIASGEATDIACGRSDIVLPPHGLASLCAAVQGARAALRVIHQNLAWAFVYNVIAIPLAACGYVTPLMAGAGMAASSMLVVANSLRLARRPAAASA